MDEPTQHESMHTNELDAVKAKCDEYLAGWKRAQADYANAQKDMDRQRAEFSKYANERLLTELLPAIDQYETALQFTPDVTELSPELKTKFTNWITGLHAVKNLWETSFQSIGLEKISCDGAFDPLMAEAVGHEPSDTVPEGNIIRTIQSGWRLHGKLLRPAKVIVSSTKTL